MSAAARFPGPLITGAAWQFDAAGRITRVESNRDGRTDYVYDAVGQLVEARRQRGAEHPTVEQFSYDAAGNRTSTTRIRQEVGSAPTTTTTLSSTHTHNRLASDGTYHYEYDAEGNRTARIKTATSERTEYVYDHRQRLVEVREWRLPAWNVPASESFRIVRYEYDLFDRRVARIDDPSPETSLIDAAFERFVYDAPRADGLEPVLLDFTRPGDGSPESGSHAWSLARRYLPGPRARVPRLCEPCAARHVAHEPRPSGSGCGAESRKPNAEPATVDAPEDALLDKPAVAPGVTTPAT